MRRFVFTSLLLLMPSVCGRSPFLSALKPYLKGNVDLSETFLSFAFTSGNLLASGIVPILGNFFGNICLTNAFRWIYAILLIGLLSFSSAIGMHLCKILTFFLLFLGYTSLRCGGQGLLPSFVKSYSAFLYNDQQCAWLSAWHYTVHLFAGLFLYILSACHAFAYWNWILWCQIGILLLYIVWTPRHLPKIPSVQIHSLSALIHSFRKFPFAFILGMSLIAWQNFHATGILFHLSNFAQEQSVPLEKIFKIFFPISILTFLFTPISSWLYARIRFCWMFFMLMGTVALINGFLLFLKNDFCIGCFIAVIATSWALNHTLSYTLVARILPQTQYSIGYATLAGLVSFGSAIGPFVYSCCSNVLGGYKSVGTMMLWINLAILLWFWWLCKYSKSFSSV